MDLAAEEPDISHRNWWRAKQSKKERDLDLHLAETQLKMNANLVPYLLDM